MKFPDIDFRNINSSIQLGGKLTGLEIHKRVLNGDILIDPYTTKQLNPNSYNLRLDNKLKVYRYDDFIDSHAKNQTEDIYIPEDGYVLMPNKLYLGRTVERVATNLFIPSINGRSSGGRLGMSIHICAGFGDIGFNGTWTLEITVAEPLKIYAGDEVAQVCFDTPHGDTTYLYNGRYQCQEDVTASKFGEEKCYSADTAIEAGAIKQAIKLAYNKYGSFIFSSEGFSIKNSDFSLDLYPGEHLVGNFILNSENKDIGRRFIINNDKGEYLYVRR